MHFGFRKINPSDVVALCIALNELINFVNCAIRLNNFVNTSGGTIIRQVDRVGGGYSSQSENIVQRKKRRIHHYECACCPSTCGCARTVEVSQ